MPWVQALDGEPLFGKGRDGLVCEYAGDFNFLHSGPGGTGVAVGWALAKSMPEMADATPEGRTDPPHGCR